MPDESSQRRESWPLLVLFCAALVAQFVFTTTNWKAGFMPRHEFRQTQTAIVSYYIDQQNNFSLLYETPVVGKPWVSVLLEVPFYEWSVVLLSRATHWPHYLAARTISLTCFYLALPSFYLLLARFRLPPPRRLLVLTLIVLCPVYVFYSRAFLMESMEILCCGWFLLGFVRALDERKASWLALAVVAGILAALIKSITFAVWLVPAAAYGAWMIGRDVRSGRGWRPALATALWSAATVVLALGLLKAWIAYTDPLKAKHASAWIFTSKNLSEGNWGIANIRARFSADTWSVLLDRWREALMPPWLVFVALGAGLLLPGQRWRVLGCSAVFFIAQLMFPFAYAYQDYYYYACAVFLMAAFGFAFIALLDAPVPRGVGLLALAAFLVAPIATYWNGYRPEQKIISNGGFPFTDAIRDLTPQKSVIVIDGTDWAAIVPYYAQRKALSIRNGLEYDNAYLSRAFEDLADEDVSALVMVGDQRKNAGFVTRATTKFGLEAKPTFSGPEADVYIKKVYAEDVRSRLAAANPYGVVLQPRSAEDRIANGPFEVSPGMARASFANFSPAPFKAFFTFGLGHSVEHGDDIISAHPNCDLWIRPPPNATTIYWEYGIHNDAYERDGDVTDGVDFIIEGESPDGHRRPIYHRLLDPATVPADRGRQHETIKYQPLPGEVLVFSNRPNMSTAYDWAYWRKIEVK